MASAQPPEENGVEPDRLYGVPIAPEKGAINRTWSGRTDAGRSLSHLTREDALLGTLAREMTSEGRERRDIFAGFDLFGDPAWNIMLELFAARIEGKVVDVPNACALSGTTTATARRYLSLLEKKGLLESIDDHAVGRVDLSELALGRLRNYLRRVASAR